MIVTGTAQRAAWQQRVLPPVERVRPDVWSIPVPIPHNPLRYTLIYAFLGDSGVTLVDAGWDSPEGRAALADGLTAAGASLADVTGLAITHIHPDHHGLSGWVREQSGAWIGMHPLEAENLPVRLWDAGKPDDDLSWLRANGVPEDQIDSMIANRERMAHALAMVEPDRAIEDGDILPMAGHEVRAIWTPGHTPGHLCLHDSRDGILLTGDHLLPRISPNIGAHPGGQADPLSDYLVSLESTAKYVSEEALPAHEYRFRGIDDRAAALIRHHDDRGLEILHAIDATGSPTTWQIAASLTWSRGWDALHGFLRRMALAETLAHLRHLVATGGVTTGEVNPAAGTPWRWSRVTSR